MRKIRVSKSFRLDVETLDKRERQWVEKILRFLEDEQNSIETLHQLFKPLQAELKGYLKAKNRSFGLRLVFRILNAHEIELMVERDEENSLLNVIIDIIGVGKRESIYGKVAQRIPHKG